MTHENNPPSDYRHHDTLDERLREERPEHEARSSDGAARTLEDDETEAVGDTHPGVLDDDDRAAEEEAIHVAVDAPGAVSSDVDSYTGEKISR
jgi:hypothetical protein